MWLMYNITTYVANVYLHFFNVWWSTKYSYGTKDILFKKGAYISKGHYFTTNKITLKILIL